MWFTVWKGRILKLIDLLAWWVVFTNCPEDRGSIPGRVIPKTHIMVLETALLNTQHYKIRIIPGNRVAPSPSPQCSSYLKGSRRVTLDNGRRLYFHHHHVGLPARISLTLSRHSSLSSIAPGTSPRLHAVSAHRFLLVVLPLLVHVMGSTGVCRLSSSLLLPQCPACLVRLT